ncbi:MAG: 3-hydroxyisobutyrate dehydrogenase [Geminicoccaceae bacterium]
MARIGFIGLGNMGLPMVRNLLRAGHTVTAFDVVAGAVEAAATAGAGAARSAVEVASTAEVVITMLPEGRHVREVYLGTDGVIAAAEGGALLIDCSTIDVATARAVWQGAAERGLEMVDAPVSGGVAGAANATLTFMVGGEEGAVARARPVLEQLGATIVHTGPSGSGQAAKICNNMMLAISMIGVAEAFTMAERLGLSAEALFQVASRSSGQSWALTGYCPVPGLVPSAPANRDYQAGFTAAMMAKDLRLAQDAANSVDAATPLGSEARNLYALFKARGHGDLDFSAIIKMIAGEL